MSATDTANGNTSAKRSTRRVIVSVAVVAAVLLGWFVLRDMLIRVDPPRGPSAGAAPELVAAIEEARDEVISHPRLAEHWGNLGSVFLANNFHVEAAACYREAAALEPNENGWRYLQAVAVEYSDLEGALPLYERAVSLPEAGAYQLVRYGLACERAGHLDKAVSLWTQAVAAQSGNVDAHLGLGRIALGRQELGAAAQHFTRALEIDAKYRESHIALIQIANRQGDRETVERHRAMLPQCYAERPPLFDPLLIDVQRRWVTLQFVTLLAQADRQEAEGNLAAFVATCRELIDLDPDKPQPRIRLGIALIRMRRVDEAVAVFDEAAKRHPNDASVHYNYGVALSQMGRWEAAAEQFREAIANKPDDAESLYGLGVCLQEAGKREEAAASFEHAVAARPDHFDAHFKLGDILPGLKRREEALAHLRVAQKLRPDDKRVIESLDKLQSPVETAPGT